MGTLVLYLLVQAVGTLVFAYSAGVVAFKDRRPWNIAAAAGLYLIMGAALAEMAVDRVGWSPFLLALHFALVVLGVTVIAGAGLLRERQRPEAQRIPALLAAALVVLALAVILLVVLILVLRGRRGKRVAPAYAEPRPVAPSTGQSPSGGQTPAPEHKFCGHCGQPLEPGKSFCVHCGQPVGG